MERHQGPSDGRHDRCGEVKNTIDLCYQTLALADIDKAKYESQIRKNAERILSLQRPDGQWAARFEASQPVAEFQTGHALWALQAAGIPATDPRVAKSIQFLLGRQQGFGGWMDPLQSYENFRTPFRETQMSILALSAYFPKSGRAKGWNARIPPQLSTEPVELLEQLDQIWDAPGPTVLQQITKATESNDALIRQAAVEALGRLGQLPDAKLLGDPSKMVQRTAAWAIRQSHVRHPERPVSDIESALASPDDRTRWGGTRIFAAHFAGLANQSSLAASLQRLVSSEQSPLVQLDATKGLWQFWFWSRDTKTKSSIEDGLLARLGKKQPTRGPSASYNMRSTILLTKISDTCTTTGYPCSHGRRIGSKRSVDAWPSKRASLINSPQCSNRGRWRQKKQLLTSLTELPLRRGDVYDLESDLSKPTLAYNRIGNDIEQIAFLGESAERFARALKPLLTSDDEATRTLASRAVLLVRDTRFGDVNRLAGKTGDNVAFVKAKVETMPEAVKVARSLKPPPVTSAVTNAGQSRPVKARLDEAYFRGYVQPILEKRGKDGYACVHCHATHTQFNGTYARL